MTPVMFTQRCTPTLASSQLILAAGIVRDAAELLVDEALEITAAARFLRVADCLAAVLGSPRVGRQRLLLASSALTERSGRDRTLVETIEAGPGDDAALSCLAKLLFRVLLWRPETFPTPHA